MSDPVRVPPFGGPGHWRRWLLPVLASAAWLVLTFCLYRHAVQGEQAHLLELCHTRLAATAHQLMDARDWNAGHGGVYVPLSAYGEPNPWLPEKDRTLRTADGRTLVLMNPAYMSRQMAERLTEPGFRLAIVGQAPLRPGNRADDWERRILATATQGGQVFFSGEDCLPQGRLRLLRTLAAQESCLRCHQGHKEGDMLGGISISMDAAAYVRDLERKQRELGLLYGLLALTGVLAVGGITSNLTLRRLQAEEKSRLKSAFMGRLSHDMRTPLAAMLGMSDLLDRQDCGIRPWSICAGPAGPFWRWWTTSPTMLRWNRGTCVCAAGPSTCPPACGPARICTDRRRRARGWSCCCIWRRICPGRSVATVSACGRPWAIW